jgi:hypothetical protein
MQISLGGMLTTESFIKLKNVNSVLRFELFLCEDVPEYHEFIRLYKSRKKRVVLLVKVK